MFLLSPDPRRIVFSPASGGGSGTAAALLKKLNVNVFVAGFIWPLWVAQEKGFFAARGLEVELISTPNSLLQMAGLIDGKFDIAMTAIDNVIAYMEGQGEAHTESKPNIVSVMGSDNGFLSLMVAPYIKTIADLRGATLSVDAMTTGYAFALRRMLEVGGLKETDYTLVKVGGMKERYAAMLAGDQAGTLLVPPYTVIAKSAGFNELGTALSVLEYFQGGVAAVRREWAENHGSEIAGFIQGYIAALGWLYDPANKEAALNLFQKHLPGTSRDAAEQSSTILLHPADGFRKLADIDFEGVRIVMDVRSQFAKPQKVLKDPSRYYDLTYYNAALATR